MPSKWVVYRHHRWRLPRDRQAGAQRHQWGPRSPEVSTVAPVDCGLSGPAQSVCVFTPPSLGPTSPFVVATMVNGTAPGSHIREVRFLDNGRPGVSLEVLEGVEELHNMSATLPEERRAYSYQTLSVFDYLYPTTAPTTHSSLPTHDGQPANADARGPQLAASGSYETSPAQNSYAVPGWRPIEDSHIPGAQQSFQGGMASHHGGTASHETYSAASFPGHIQYPLESGGAVFDASQLEPQKDDFVFN